jgi:hypothetical protein
MSLIIGRVVGCLSQGDEVRNELAGAWFLDCVRHVGWRRTLNIVCRLGAA